MRFLRRRRAEVELTAAEMCALGNELSSDPHEPELVRRGFDMYVAASERGDRSATYELGLLHLTGQAQMLSAEYVRGAQRNLERGGGGVTRTASLSYITSGQLQVEVKVTTPSQPGAPSAAAWARRENELRQSVTHFKVAANKGHTKAMVTLGCILRDGLVLCASEDGRMTVDAADRLDTRPRVFCGPESPAPAPKNGHEADEADARERRRGGAPSGPRRTESVTYDMNGRPMKPVDQSATTIVERSHSQAFKLFTKAAEMRDADAQCNLAAMHANGQGCHKNLEQARAWFSVAAEQDKNLSAKAVALTNVTQIDLKLRIMQSIADQYTAGAGVRVVIFGDRRADLNGRRGVVKKFLNAMHTGSIFLVVLDDEERGKSTKRASGKAEKRMVRRRPGYDVELSDEEEPTRVVEEVEVFPGNLREEKGGGKSSRAPNQDEQRIALANSMEMRSLSQDILGDLTTYTQELSDHLSDRASQGTPPTSPNEPRRPPTPMRNAHRAIQQRKVDELFTKLHLAAEEADNLRDQARDEDGRVDQNKLLAVLQSMQGDHDVANRSRERSRSRSHSRSHSHSRSQAGFGASSGRGLSPARRGTPSAPKRPKAPITKGQRSVTAASGYQHRPAKQMVKKRQSESASDDPPSPTSSSSGQSAQTRNTEGRSGHGADPSTDNVGSEQGSDDMDNVRAGDRVSEPPPSPTLKTFGVVGAGDLAHHNGGSKADSKTGSVARSEKSDTSSVPPDPPHNLGSSPSSVLELGQ